MLTPVPVAPYPDVVRPAGWVVLPTVVAASLLAHGAVLVAIALLPVPSRIAPVPAQLDFEVLAAAPVVTREPEAIPEPPPPPVVEEPTPLPDEAPAAIVPPRPRRVATARTSEPTEAPAPPSPVITSGREGGGDWAHPPGEAGGRLDGTPGGTGTGPATAAMPVVPAEPAREPGISRAHLRRLLAGYIRDTLSRFLHGRIDYPLAASRAGMEGVTLLRVRLARDGRILAVRLSRTSGHDMLDQAALSSVQRLVTMPAPPAEIPWDEGQELPLPVTFVVGQ